MTGSTLPALLQSFFTDRLLHQRQASPHTIAGYRDCFRPLLHFAKERLGKTLRRSCSKISMPLFLVVSSNTWKMFVKTVPVREMHDWGNPFFLPVRSV